MNKVIGLVGEVFPNKPCRCNVCDSLLQNDWGFVLEDKSTICKDQFKCNMVARKKGLIKTKSWKDA